MRNLIVSDSGTRSDQPLTVLGLFTEKSMQSFIWRAWSAQSWPGRMYCETISRRPTASSTARQKHVKRVVFASSIHFHGFLRRQVPATADTPYRPDSLSGVAKIFGEATGRLYADKYGLEVVCLRIAFFRPRPTSRRELGTWLSPNDAVRLVKASLSAADIHFEILYGVSKNSVGFYETGRSAELGYFPQDDSDAFALEVLNTPGAEPEPQLEAAFHGAHFIFPGFKGKLAKI